MRTLRYSSTIRRSIRTACPSQRTARCSLTTGHWPLTTAFTLIELLVVVAIILLLAALTFPALQAHFENARIGQARNQLAVLEAALAQYQRAFGDYPPSSGPGDNPGSESLAASLRTALNGGPFLNPNAAKISVADIDNDGRPELLDPWKNPWIYFHPADYTAPAPFYRFGSRRTEVSPARKPGDEKVSLNLTTYQLWSCGPNKTGQSGQGDDIGNVHQ